MRINYLIPLLLFFFVSLSGSAQNIPYKSYVSAYGPFGQPFLRYQHNDNFLYSADKRFGVTATGIVPVGNVTEQVLFDGSYDQYGYQIPAGGTAVITIDFTANGGVGFGYPAGKVIANFYAQGNPGSITARIQRSSDDAWFDITDWTNISISPTYYV